MTEPTIESVDATARRLAGRWTDAGADDFTHAEVIRELEEIPGLVAAAVTARMCEVMHDDAAGLVVALTLLAEAGD